MARSSATGFIGGGAGRLSDIIKAELAAGRLNWPQSVVSKAAGERTCGTLNMQAKAGNYEPEALFQRVHRVLFDMIY